MWLTLKVVLGLDPLQEEKQTRSGQSLCQTTRTRMGSLTVSMTPSLNPKMTLTKFYIFLFSKKKKSNKKIHTARLLPHVCRTCGCAVNLPHNHTCGAASLNPVSERRVDSSFLVFSLSSHRYSYIKIQNMISEVRVYRV